MSQTPVAPPNALGAGMLALGGLVPSFTGDGTTVCVREFFQILEQVGSMGGWQDSQLIGIARCKMVGSAYAFAWQDECVAAVTTFTAFKALAFERFDTEPQNVKLSKFLAAKQNAGEDVRAFAGRLRVLGNATLGTNALEGAQEKREMRRQLLSEQMLSQFVGGLRDPIRRFTLSRDPETFDGAIEIAVKEERNERIVNGGTQPVRRVEEPNKAQDEVRERLDRLERLFEQSLSLRGAAGTSQRRSPPRTPRKTNSGCFVCGTFGHFARSCPHRHRDGRADIRQIEDGDQGEAGDHRPLGSRAAHQPGN